MLMRYSKLDKNSDNNYISADLEIDKTSVLGKGNIIVGKKALGGGVIIEKGAVIGNDNILEGAGGIYIGSYTRIGNGVHMISLIPASLNNGVKTSCIDPNKTINLSSGQRFKISFPIVSILILCPVPVGKWGAYDF